MSKDMVVGFRGQPFDSSITIADAASYVTGNVIAGAGGTAIFTYGSTLLAMNSTADGIPEDGSVLRANAPNTGRSIQVNGLRLVSSSTSLVFTGEIQFFCKAMVVADAAAFAPSNADLTTYYLGKIDFNVSDWTIMGTSAVLALDNLDKVWMFPDPEAYAIVTGQMWGVLITRQSVSAAGNEVLASKVLVSKD